MEADARKRRWDEAAAEASAGPKLDNDAVAQAAAIAAKIAASLRPGGSGQELVKRDHFEGDYVKDIEVNDLRNRYALTKASTIKSIQDETGASVQVKGVWAPDRSRMPPGELPLYLHVVATSQVILDAAVDKINELINQELGPLIEDRTLIARNRALGLPPPQGVTERTRERVKWPEERLQIGLESFRNFNIRAKIVGPGGMFMKYIQAETGARVQVKGRGSGFLEQDTGRESDEPMHVSIAAPTEEQVQRAKALAEDLIVVLRQEHEKARGGPGGGGVYQPGYGTYSQAGQGQGGYGGGYGAADHQQQQTAGAADASVAAGQTAATGGGPAPLPGTEEYNQWAQYWAAYGYDVNDPQFQAWYASQYGSSAGQAESGAQPATT